MRLTERIIQPQRGSGLFERIVRSPARYKQHVVDRGTRGKMSMLSGLMNIPLNFPQNTIILTLLHGSIIYLWIKIATYSETNENI